MTVAQFLAELEKTPRDWTIRRAGDGWLIRRSRSAHCPLSAVAGTLPGSILAARDALRMANFDAFAVASAADGEPHCNRNLRRQIKDACGL